MKTNAIIRIIVWSLVLVLLGGILCSFLLGRTYLNDHSTTAVNPEAGITDMDLSGNVVASGEAIYFDADSISNIKIEWAAGDITIVKKDYIPTIRIVEEVPADNRYTMVAKTNGQTLKLQFCEESASLFGIGNHSVLSKDLTIEVPEYWTCQNLELDVAAANLEIHKLAITDVDIDGASGTCNFVNCMISNLDIDTASGDVTFSGFLDTLDFDAASASFYGEFQNTPQSIDMDGLSGKLDIALPEDCGYSLNMDGMSTRFTSDFQGAENRNGTHIYGDGRCRIQADGMNVDVNIRKADNIIK
ncbi:MAG: DUF4097 family beta strand repeat protein [Oscillospiraceae bacterium]|nr:DUF4097 family beta strand repeat protein [Oscillospiraceae bacterium]